MIDIVMITWHRQEITETAIKAIRKNTPREEYRLIVIDNGSPKEMQDRLLVLQDNGYIDNLILNETNRGLEPARNQGLAEVETDLFICADNDCLPMKKDKAGSWLYKLNVLMSDNPDYGAISARTQVMIGTGNIFEEADENGDDIVEFPHPGGSLRIMRSKDVREVGGWRNDVDSRGAEERYICGQLREKGFRTGFATHIKCLHLFGDRTKQTDRWGYPEDWKPEDTGHTDVWHPVLGSGDDPQQVKEYYSA